MRLGAGPAEPRPRGASRSRGSTDRRPGRCRSRRPGRRARRGTPRGSRRAPASSTRGSVSSRACPARRALRSGRRRCRACTSRSPARAARIARARLRDERAEHDPRAVTPRDQHRVLAVEADARADGALAVDVVVLVDEHAVLASEPAAERVELLAELRVARRTRCSAAAGPRPGPGARLRRVVAERRGDDGARVREQRLRVAGDLRPGHREAHVGEEPARPALGDVPLGRLVGLGRSRPDDVDAELGCDPLQLRRGHERIVPQRSHFET